MLKALVIQGFLLFAVGDSRQSLSASHLAISGVVVMLVSTELKNGIASVRLDGKFTFADHREFRQAVKDLLAGPAMALEIDFAKVTYLDSSALGMLLLAREEATANSKTVSLLNCTGTVGQILALANFQKLFTIR